MNRLTQFVNEIYKRKYYNQTQIAPLRGGDNSCVEMMMNTVWRVGIKIHQRKLEQALT